MTITPIHFDTCHPQSIPDMNVRIAGYDIARSFALFGMTLINFTYIMADFKHSSALSKFLMNILNGRAAATFVILAGVGMSLLSRQARLTDNGDALGRHRTVLLKRAAFLFLTGLCFTLMWNADILHFYGVYIAVGACLLRATDRFLCALITGFISISLMMMLAMEYEPDMGWALIDAAGSWHPETGLKNLFFNGYHPVFPWTAFLILGLWLGRQNIYDPVFRKNILTIGAIVYISTESLSRAAIYFISNYVPAAKGGILMTLLGTNPMPATPFYMLSAGAASLVMIVLSIMLTDHPFILKWIKPFADAGQLSLTLYIVHIAIGTSMVYVFEVTGEYEDLSIAVRNTALFYSVAVLFAFIWKKHFTRGPLEWIMRWTTR
ncbi:MAG: DUF418 domain-containing protein [Desulfobacterales bacterium]|nr:DUF418 domain-containing protein [Desulfobacterales bacterium]